MRLAFATAISAHGLDEDLPLLLKACAEAGIAASVLAWDDPTVSWSRFDAVLLRSTWDYTERLAPFLAWCERVDRVTTLLNPLPVLRWNTDKHYLADLQGAGVPVVASVFVEPDAEPLPAVQAFLSTFADAAEFVVKPAVGAGSRDTQRYARAQAFAAANHVGRLLAAGRSVLLQPYLPSVDVDGETALLYFDGEFSHAIRKGPLLRPDEGPTSAPVRRRGDHRPHARRRRTCRRQRRPGGTAGTPGPGDHPALCPRRPDPVPRGPAAVAGARTGRTLPVLRPGSRRGGALRGAALRPSAAAGGDKVAPFRRKPVKSPVLNVPCPPAGLLAAPPPQGIPAR